MPSLTTVTLPNAFQYKDDMSMASSLVVST